MLVAEMQLVTRPREGKLGQRLANPHVAAGVTKKDEVLRADIGIGHFGVVFYRQLAAHVTCPLVGEAAKGRVGPRGDNRVPWLTGPAHAEERSGERVVNRT